MKHGTRSRRQFLRHLVWLGAGGPIVPRAWAEAASRMAHDPVACTLRAVLGHMESAVAVGKEYLRLASEERERDRLVHLISERCGERVFATNGEHLRRCVSHGVRRDFAEGHVVKVHGWVLSVTEARLCGLAALIAAPGRALGHPIG